MTETTAGADPATLPEPPRFLARAREFYDAVAEDYVARFRDELPQRPWDRAALGVFAEGVRANGGGLVADVGCGPGRLTGTLRSLGLDVFGVDLSPAMLALAREAHPGVRFTEGSMTALDVADGSLGGLVAWYSVIHVPPARHPEVFAGFHRALAPGGRLQLAFQVGQEALRVTEPFGRPVALDFHRMDPERVRTQLGEAGFAVEAVVVREAVGTERVPQAYVLARKP
ncbi:class I SAM-dependent methyltransferase [Streptomyces sp. ICBB 8177]|uniref:class I SAM-dependent DNA methyltransferase n=1 Tax=Streptomyces sp. ICBB 8177 TaxID=563922 RepID=UPI000D6836DF|nr:class I SAM-dependent methyltransferase [Streptomyces sp. ICBB 8177]PWI45810.1 SAM-dependent methyltransferase [Streptomyces sp. ICBB 8177]